MHSTLARWYVGCAGSAVGALLMPSAAQAAQWTLESNVQTTVESNDNPALAPVSPASTQRLTWNGSGTAARRTESGTTRLDAAVNLLVAGSTRRPAPPTAEGRLAFSHDLALERDNFSANVEVALVDDLNESPTATDVYAGRGRRTTRAASLRWVHLFSERLSAQAGTREARTDTAADVATASDYGDRSLSVGLTYRWDELLRIGASLQRSEYEQLPGPGGTESDTLSFTMSRALDERTNLSASYGRYRTARTGAASSLACPLPQAFCSAGLVQPVLVTSETRSKSYGTQYDLSWDWAASEVASLRVTAASGLKPSGSGVAREDRFSASLSRAFSPRWSGAATFGHSRSSLSADNTAAEPRLTTLELGTRWMLTERLSLSGAVTQRRYSEPRAGVRAESNAISITLQYQGPRADASR